MTHPHLRARSEAVDDASRWSEASYAILLLLAVAALRAPVFFNRAFNGDEIYYAVGAQKLLAGGLFYRDVVDHKPPGIYWLYAAVMHLTGGMRTLAAIHATLIGTVWLSGLLLGRLGRALLGAKVGRLAGTFYAVACGIGPPGDFLAANGELFMNLPAIAALTLVCVPAPPHRGGAGASWRAAGAGLLTAASAFIKPQAAVVGVPVALYGFMCLRAGPPMRMTRAARIVGSYLLPALLPAVSLVLGYRAAHALDDLRWAARYGATVYAHALGLREKLVNGLRNSTLMALVYIPLLLPAGLYLAAARERDSERDRLRHPSRAGVGPAPRLWPPNAWRVPLVLSAWLAASFAAVCAGGRFYPHYFIQLLPPLCLLAAAGLAPPRNHPRAKLMREAHARSRSS